MQPVLTRCSHLLLFIQPVSFQQYSRVRQLNTYTNNSKQISKSLYSNIKTFFKENNSAQHSAKCFRKGKVPRFLIVFIL